jgi:hypothetical protein
LLQSVCPDAGHETGAFLTPEKGLEELFPNLSQIVFNPPKRLVAPFGASPHRNQLSARNLISKNFKPIFSMDGS